MPPPSPLDIARQSVQRLLKEEKSYQKELAQQERRVSKLEDNIQAGNDPDGNADYVLKQEVWHLTLFSQSHEWKPMSFL